MFEIKTTYLDNSAQIEFPCDGYHLHANMDKLRIPDSEKPTAQLFVNEINYEKLKGLENQFLDPDVLNFLAQKMDSFDKNESVHIHQDTTVKLNVLIVRITNISMLIIHFTLLMISQSN